MATKNMNSAEGLLYVVARVLVIPGWIGLVASLSGDMSETMVNACIVVYLFSTSTIYYFDNVHEG